MKDLYNWLFHYNPHTKSWYGFHRDDYVAYWNKGEFKHKLFKDKQVSGVISDITSYINESN